MRCNVPDGLSRLAQKTGLHLDVLSKFRTLEACSLQSTIFQNMDKWSPCSVSLSLSLSLSSGNICSTQMDTILCCVIFCSLKKNTLSSNASSNSRHFEHVLRNQLLSKSQPFYSMLCFSLSLF